MGIEIIPAVALLFIIIFSGPSEMDTSTSYPKGKTYPPVSVQRKEKKTDSREIERKFPGELARADQAPEKPQSDYKAIYEYIRDIYPNISEDEARQISQYLVDYGAEHSIDPKLTAALIARESGFNKNAVSSTGAKGLGQIKNFNYKSLEIDDPFNIKENARGTSKYLKSMMKFWNDKSSKVSLALASYYKGHGAVKRDNEQLDSTTKYYVQDILKNYEEIKGYSKEN